MRWSIIRLIWLRELRDQLRDRRTLFMIFVVPLLLYPVLGLAVLKVTEGFALKTSVIGIVRGDGPNDFPPRVPLNSGRSVIPQISWLSATSAQQIVGAAAMAQAGHERLDYPQ